MKKAILFSFLALAATPALASELSITDTCQKALGKAAARVANQHISSDKYKYIGDIGRDNPDFAAVLFA